MEQVLSIRNFEGHSSPLSSEMVEKLDFYDFKLLSGDTV